MLPIHPAPTPWIFPDPTTFESDLIGTGADLEPGTILAAYRRGLFPMPVDGQLGWWSPDPRGILPLEGFRVSRSLRASARRFELRVDTAFESVVEGCADPARTGSWIDEEVKTAYLRLHDLGWAHSVEAWSLDDGSLAGGLYGLSIHGLFAGESMFHRQRDASKVALLGLVELLDDGVGDRLLDVQWLTPHLASLGAVEIPKTEYLRRLELALELPSTLFSRFG